MITITINLSQQELAELRTRTFSLDDLESTIARRVQEAVQQQNGRRAEIAANVATLQAVAARRTHA